MSHWTAFRWRLAFTALYGASLGLAALGFEHLANLLELTDERPADVTRLLAWVLGGFAFKAFWLARRQPELELRRALFTTIGVGLALCINVALVRHAGVWIGPFEAFWGVLVCCLIGHLIVPKPQAVPVVRVGQGPTCIRVLDDAGKEIGVVRINVAALVALAKGDRPA